MRLILSILLLSTSFFVMSQDIKREEIIGKIIVEGSDIEGITVYNSSSQKGSVTDANGQFIIAVALNDMLEFRALEYQSIDVTVNKAVLESNRMSVYLIEKMNILDEVVIPKKELSGNLVTDANKLTTFNPKLDAFYFSISYDEISGLGDDGESQIDYLDRNEQGKTMVNGLNVVNVVDQLLIPLFRSEVPNKEEAGVPEVPAENIKYYLGSDYLVENFSIPEHRVEEFIRYVEDDTFDFELLNYGHELEFLELLSRKSTLFLNEQKNFQ
ncbi:carboxypeptidase-like regulatory domain-containing protein [Lutimonas sp.]|uniref:carboxypeptidase-like regulatory domain-containing protein n=1 Tax=Lutimonas sp. TaxID=1872403 RepID=UPI003D9AF6E9